MTEGSSVHRGLRWGGRTVVLAALVLTGVLGLLIGIPALRFHGLYLAFVTLAVGVAFNPIVKRMRWLTNGSDGKASKATRTPPRWFGRSRDDQRLWVYVVVVSVALVTFALVSNMVRGRLGRRWPPCATTSSARSPSASPRCGRGGSCSRCRPA